jgi:hypothetical protein
MGGSGNGTSNVPALPWTIWETTPVNCGGPGGLTEIPTWAEFVLTWPIVSVTVNLAM